MATFSDVEQQEYVRSIIIDKNTQNTTNDESIFDLEDTPIHSTQSINCFVCQKPKTLSNYKRHLLIHVKNQELSEDRVRIILFQSRKIRKDTKTRNLGKPSIGYTCLSVSTSSKQCNLVVFDLKRHLLNAHNVECNSEEFEDLIQRGINYGYLERAVGKKIGPIAGETDTINPSKRHRHDIGNIFDSVDLFSPQDIQNESLCHRSVSPRSQSLDSVNILSIHESCTNHPSFTNTQQSSNFPKSISFHEENDESGYHKLIKFGTDKIINQFQSFLLTKGGGGRRIGPVKGDISSFRCLIKDLGWNNFWDPNSLNTYVTNAVEDRLTPSTIYGRLRVYERFIDFLRIELPTFLPSEHFMKAISAMLRNLKESLRKDRHARNKITMAISRECMPKSLSILKDWRLKRETVPVKQLFREVTSNVYLLNGKVFVKLRNYLIVEIILANAQQSGIIEGMMIKEVLTARSNVNSDNNHYMYVQNHKTGYKQPAIIFLEDEIFQFLLQYVTILLPSLPPLVPERNLNDCPVFQSWRSNSLPSNTVCYCLRSGLLLFGIVDHSSCPPQYRKAASTLTSMQEPLSQFMCHERSTAERHYQHHMSHRYLSSVFTELAKCQTNPDEASALEKVSDPDLNDPVLLSEPVVEHSTSAGCIDYNDSQDPDSDSLSHSLVSISLTTDPIGELIELVTDEDNLDSSNECTSPRYSDLHEEFPYKSKYSRKRNGKIIFPNQ